MLVFIFVEIKGLRNKMIWKEFNRGQWWHAVAAWTWDAQDETCGIWRMAFDGCCPDCKLPGDDCPLRNRFNPRHGNGVD
ncbi:anaphase-promoting complex subunit 11-like isoform X6 [Rosa rugosa]|uniref:anaphase-promoting complex subunit 11-like isoform X6 n=1 Tax=Rosa rugosa TaxID=74645 RepID=UPI002B4174DD|nr:anaphase-promoting complex subunit 11-like isoform X6 [Rosa rugosa]